MKITCVILKNIYFYTKYKIKNHEKTILLTIFTLHLGVIINSLKAQVCTNDPNISTTDTTKMFMPSDTIICTQAGKTGFAQTFTRYAQTTINSQIGPLTIDSVHLDSISGLPPGFIVTCGNASCFQTAGTIGCFTISGNIPNINADYNIKIWVTPYGVVPGLGNLQDLAGSIVEKTYTIIARGTVGISSWISSKANAKCKGNSDGSATVSVACYNGTPQYSWAPTGGTTQTASGLTAGTYTCTISDLSSVITQTVAIQDSIKTNASQLTISNATCNGNDGSASFGYNFNCSLGCTYLWSNGSSIDHAENLTVGVNSVTVTTLYEDYNNGSSFSCSADTSFVIVDTMPMNPTPICLVTVDPTSTHNVIIWEKPISTVIDSFAIYRETTTNSYEYIAAIAYDSLSEYHELSANPNVTSYKYSIVVLDKCGKTSNLGDLHSTIHLQSLGGGNFQWTEYYIYSYDNLGYPTTYTPVTYYKLYRDDNGTGNFLPISSTIPGNNTTYTDINYASFPNARYYIEAVWSISCTPSRSVSSTRSNIKSLNATGIMSQNELKSEIVIYPNPASIKVNITLPEMVGSTNLAIVNVLGETVHSQIITSKTTTINIENFAKGIYTVIVKNNGNMAFKKLVVD